MVMVFNGEKWRAGRWHNIKYCEVKNKNNQLYDAVKYQVERGDREPGDNLIGYFNINGLKVTLDDLYCRYGFTMGFDLKCERYPKQINCYTDIQSIYNPVYCELDEYGEKLRVWEEVDR